MEKPEIHFCSSGPSGNIYAILNMFKDQFRKEGRIKEYNDTWDRVCMSHSYEEALAIMREKVTLIDDDGRY